MGHGVLLMEAAPEGVLGCQQHNQMQTSHARVSLQLASAAMPYAVLAQLAVCLQHAKPAVLPGVQAPPNHVLQVSVFA
jgi:hypothetical protein